MRQTLYKVSIFSSSLGVNSKHVIIFFPSRLLLFSSFIRFPRGQEMECEKNSLEGGTKKKVYPAPNGFLKWRWLFNEAKINERICITGSVLSMKIQFSCGEKSTNVIDFSLEVVKGKAIQLSINHLVGFSGLFFSLGKNTFPVRGKSRDAFLHVTYERKRLLR